MRVKLPKKMLIDALNGELEGCEVLRNLIVGMTRWTSVYEFVFEHGGRCYRSMYELGATENQDTQPWEYCGAEVQVDVVEPYEKTVTDFRLVDAPQEATES